MLRITKMLMLEVGTYNDQFQRPYQAHVDGLSLQQLQEASNWGRNLTPGALGHVGANIMRLSSTTAGSVQIAEGFDTPRLCFMMEVEFPGTGGITQVEWLLGYTDHVGISAMFGDNSLKFNPAMLLHFNNVMRGRRMSSTNSYGRTQHRSMDGTFQLITSPFRPSITNLHEQPHLMRPQDVFTSMSMEGARSIVGDEVLLDVRPTHGPERMAVSYRNNTIPGRYLSSMLQTWQAETESDSVDHASLNSQMAGKIAEPTIARIRSLQSLSVCTELRQGGTISWGELLDAEDSGTLEQRVVVVLAQSPQYRAQLSHRGDSEYWNGNGQTTLIATQFVQAVPGMMMELMLTEFSFSVTNQTLDGSWEVFIEGVESFNDGDNIPQVNAFVHRLRTELMPGLSRDGLIPMTIHAQFNVVGETRIQIEIENQGFVPFTTPSFCDGLFAAVRAPNAKTLDLFAHNLSKITTSLEQDRWAGGIGYEPNDQQHQPILNSQGYEYDSKGTL